MLIALIDDGIDVSRFPDIKLTHDLSVRGDGSISNRVPNECILTEHGTTTARIIAKYAPEAEFCSLRIFDDEKLRSQCGSLAAALEWCLTSRIPIIHLSAGTSSLCDYPEIRTIVSKLIQQRQAVVAAHSNKSAWSMPACQTGVFGVSADERMKGNEYKHSPLHQHRGTFLASSRHKLSDTSGIEQETQVANSYAAPTVTAAVYNAISDKETFSLTIPQIFRMLINTADYMCSHKPDFISDAYIINPSNRPLLKRHFFFNCLHEIAAPSDIIEPSAQIFDIIYLPPHIESAHSQIDRYLQRNPLPFENLLYGGVLPGDMAFRDKIVWDEGLLNTHWFDNSDADGDTDCPIVAINGNGVIPLDLTCKLRDLFLKDGYQCVCISDYPYSYLYGIDFVPDGVPGENALDYTIRTYCPDVVLYCLKPASSVFDKYSIGYSIFVRHTVATNGFHDTETTPQCNYVVQDSGSDYELLSLYNDILEYFD